MSIQTGLNRAFEAVGLKLVLCIFVTLFITACSSDERTQSQIESSWVLKWNGIAVDTSGLDHKEVAAGEDRTFGHQLGPTRSSRAMAIVHIAIADVVASVYGGFSPYLSAETVVPGTSGKAAIAQAAYETLVALYPSHASRLAPYLKQDLDHVTEEAAKTAGINLGKAIAQKILNLRANDGSQITEAQAQKEYTFSSLPGYWRVDPLNPQQKAFGAGWDAVDPFVLTNATQFRTPPPPALNSSEYTAAYNEVKAMGGDGKTSETIRSADQTEIGIFWAYDGMPSLCAPPRLYNQIAVQIGQEQNLGIVEMARLLALVNVSMADAGLAIWESKYYYNFWRPVTAIREADAGTGPSGAGDNNSDTLGDTNWSPFGAPASNLSNGINFTPPFPAYPSGHAGFGGALFETLRLFFGRDNVPFLFVSDELNGETVDNEGKVRPKSPRSFASFSEAEEENGQSRIYLGIHFSFDKTAGIEQGRNVARYVYQNIYQAN